MKYNTYQILLLRKKKFDIETPFYSAIFSNDLDLNLLGLCIGHIRMECATFEEFKEKLLTDEYQALAFFVDDLYFHEIAYRPQTDEVAVCSGMIADAIDSFTVAYPELSKEELLDYEYTLPADEFFTITKKIIDCFYAEQEWIILYKDEQNHVHVEPYKLTPEEKDRIKNWYKSNV